MTRFQLGREMTARLGNDLNAALDEPLPAPVVLESVERNIAEYMANPLDRLNDVRQPWSERPGSH